MSSVQVQDLEIRLTGTFKQRSGMIYTWAKQGKLQPKSFRELLNIFIEKEAEHRLKERTQDDGPSRDEEEFEERSSDPNKGEFYSFSGD